MNKPFTASQFTPTEWDSAEQKAKFANHFVRFVESEFSPNLFYDWFYKRLSMTFGHIAHYNRAGFYETWFSSTEARLRFLEVSEGRTGLYALPPKGMGPCGDPHFSYSDVERILMSWVFMNELTSEYRKKLATETEASDRAELARLKQKYEVLA